MEAIHPLVISMQREAWDHIDNGTAVVLEPFGCQIKNMRGERMGKMTQRRKMSESRSGCGERKNGGHTETR